MPELESSTMAIESTFAMSTEPRVRVGDRLERAIEQRADIAEEIERERTRSTLAPIPAAHGVLADA